MEPVLLITLAHPSLIFVAQCQFSILYGQFSSSNGSSYNHNYRRGCYHGGNNKNNNHNSTSYHRKNDNNGSNWQQGN